ncbi:MAG: alanine racemase [Rhodothermales bacterium]
MLIDDLSTPCLLVERARLDANLERMQARATANHVALRPHTKTHKSLGIARHQRGLGAEGITVAKVSEAEVFVEGGFDDVRLAYTVVGRDKHDRLVHLMDQARLSFCVDTMDGARAASAIYAAHNRHAEVLIEIDAGYGRCGVGWDDAGLPEFARQVAALPGLKLVGLLAHAGQSYREPEEGETAEAALRRAMSCERDRMLEAAARLHDAGVPGVEPDRALDGSPRFAISVGSTPSMTYFENREHKGFTVTEIRPGTYVYNDATQVSLGTATLHDCALTVLATVISKHRDRAGRERLFLDAGRKVFTSDTGRLTDGYGIILYNPADMVPHPHARLTGLSEEHGWVQVRGGATYGVGDRVRVVPNHVCVAVNTQDRFYVVDDDEVIHEWPVDARGCVR